MDEWAALYEADEAFRAQFNAEVVRTLSPTPELPGADAMPLTSVPDAVAMGDQIRERVRSSLFDIASKRAEEEDVKLVSFGHTHDAGLEPLPGDGVYINSGTWTWRADFTGAGKETWRDLFEHPERFTDDRLLSYVRIDYDDGGQPTGRLLAFEPPPTPDQEPEEEQQLASFWTRLVAWLKGLWAGIAGSG